MGLIERAAADWLYSIGKRRSGTVAQNGLGAGGWGGWLTEPSNQRGRIFRVERPRPRSCGPQPKTSQFDPQDLDPGQQRAVGRALWSRPFRIVFF